MAAEPVEAAGAAVVVAVLIGGAVVDPKLGPTVVDPRVVDP